MYNGQIGFIVLFPGVVSDDVIGGIAGVVDSADDDHNAGLQKLFHRSTDTKNYPKILGKKIVFLGQDTQICRSENIFHISSKLL